MAPAFPEVAVEMAGWRLAAESVETLFRLAGARVRGATRRFEDERTRQAVREATDGRIDHQWRFVAVTSLGFEPSLPPGAAPMVVPMVRREATTAFADRLRERGLEGVRERGDERIRLDSGSRARLTRYGASDPIGGGVPVVGWVCVWTAGGDIFVVTGGYPDGRLADLLALDEPDPILARSENEYRAEFLDIFGHVESGS